MLKKSGVIMMGEYIKDSSTDSGPKAGLQGAHSDLLGRSVEEDKSTLRGMKPSCRMA